MAKKILVYVLTSLAVAVVFCFLMWVMQTVFDAENVTPLKETVFTGLIFGFVLTAYTMWRSRFFKKS
ncbi:MAG: hypothetical protein LIO90_01350 [Bacteroidales bacterium]|nr:hypothetical protein [Bacteroidales bacterium]